MFKIADKSCENLDDIFGEMKDKDITICSECGCSIYPDKNHEC